MDSSTFSNTQTLVFIGGGHSHAIALKKWAMNPIPGVRLILINDVVHTPYSGMLPGYVAGLYTYDQCHIDLRPLCQFAQAQLVVDRAIGLNLENNTVLCQNHPPIAFDWLSIDIGSTPAKNQLPGVDEYAIAAKPIAKFLKQWDAVLNQVKHKSPKLFRVGVVGGGAGGVELAMAMQARLQAMGDTTSPNSVEVHLFQRGTELLPERHPWMRYTVQRTMENRQIHLHLGETVTAIEPAIKPTPNGEHNSNSDDFRGVQVRCKSGLTVVCDRVFWVTQAAAASWPSAAGLATDETGFIQVNDCLQSISHPQVFAAGDIAVMVNHPRPKAGVFAVRQGKPLYENLQRAIRRHPLKPFRPQQEFLILVGTGKERAIASRGFFTLGPHQWIWRWKDKIDRDFMDQFTDLDAAMDTPAPHDSKRDMLGLSKEAPQLEPPLALPMMHCAGCASKVGSSVLEHVLKQLQQKMPDAFHRPDVVLGVTDPDDASAIAIPQNTTLIQTLDYFRAIVDDPFIAGQIAANHCLSDLFAMGATPHSVLAIASLPYATAPILEETLYHLLAGALKVLHQADATLIGGHTIEGADLALGFSCNGFLGSETIMRKTGMQAGDRLILTKALGTGTLFAAHMQCKAKGRWIEGAIASMLQSNQDAANILRRYYATACTDITGFGLLGHLLEMVRPNPSVAVALDLKALPILPGAEDTLRQGILSSLHPQNAQAFTWVHDASAMADHPLAPLLVDPQTSGGLLATVPADVADVCLTELQNQGYRQSRIIGHVTASHSGQLPVRVLMSP